VVAVTVAIDVATAADNAAAVNRRFSQFQFQKGGQMLTAFLLFHS
jgi:hypothetical protein